MANEKAPGIDGFPCEFYKKLWDVIGPYLLCVYQEALLTRSLGAIINQGYIKFIPKIGDPKLISNRNPITLLHVSYKIIAKALALKLQFLLPQIFQLEQINFIKSWYIFQNGFAVCKGMEWDRSSQ